MVAAHIHLYMYKTYTNRYDSRTRMWYMLLYTYEHLQPPRRGWNVTAAGLTNRSSIEYNMYINTRERMWLDSGLPVWVATAACAYNYGYTSYRMYMTAVYLLVYEWAVYIHIWLYAYLGLSMLIYTVIVRYYIMLLIVAPLENRSPPTKNVHARVGLWCYQFSVKPGTWRVCFLHFFHFNFLRRVAGSSLQKFDLQDVPTIIMIFCTYNGTIFI